MRGAQQRQQQRAAVTLHLHRRGGNLGEYGAEWSFLEPMKHIAVFFADIHRDFRPVNMGRVGGRAQGEGGGDDESGILGGYIWVGQRGGRGGGGRSWDALENSGDNVMCDRTIRYRLPSVACWAKARAVGYL